MQTSKSNPEPRTEAVKQAFLRYLSAVPPMGALMINGAWGTGKTSLFNNVLLKAANERRFKVIYVSLNGCKSVDSFNRSIFLGAYPLLRKGVVQAFGALLTSALKYASITVDDLIKVEASINKSTLICVDDLERVDPSALPEILGAIGRLVEQNNAKVLFLCDEAKLLKISAYTEAKEKVIGRTISFKPTFSDIARLTIPKFYAVTSELRRISLSQSPLVPTQKQLEGVLEDTLSGANCTNFRLSHAAVRNFSDLLSATPDGTQKLDERTVLRLFRTISALTIYLGEHPASISRVRELFLLPESEHFQFYKSQNRSEHVEILERLDSRSLPPVFHISIVSLVEGEDVDALSIVDDLHRESSHTESPLLKLQRFRRLQQSEFDGALKKLFEELREGKLASLDEIQMASKLLFSLTSMKLIPQDEAEIQELLLTNIRRVSQLAKDSEQPASTLTTQLNSENYSAVHARVQDSLRIASEEIGRSNSLKHRQQLHRLVKDDPELFSQELTDNSGIFARSAIFVDPSDVDTFTNSVSSLTRNENAPELLLIVAHAIRRRYLPLDMSTIVESEVPQIHRLRSNIDKIRSEISPAQSLSRSALDDLLAHLPET